MSGIYSSLDARINAINTPQPAPSDDNTTMYVIIALFVFILVGFNIFIYLARGTEWAGRIVTAAAKNGIDLSFLGLKVASNVATQSVAGSLNALNAGIDVQRQNIGSSLAMGLPIAQNIIGANQAPEPDKAGSDIQRGGKAGYCYVGNDRGFRSCLQVSAEDSCQSNQVFPTLEVCQNPQLRP